MDICYNSVTGWQESGRSFPWGRRSPSCGTSLWSTWYTALWDSSYWITWNTWANIMFVRLCPGEITLQVQVRYLQLFLTTVAVTKDQGWADLHCRDVKGVYSTPSPFPCRQTWRLLKKLLFRYCNIFTSALSDFPIREADLSCSFTKHWLHKPMILKNACQKLDAWTGSLHCKYLSIYCFSCLQEQSKPFKPELFSELFNSDLVR